MICTGTVINTAAILAGGILGGAVEKFFTAESRDSICKTCGIAVIFISISGAMEGMLEITNTGLKSVNAMLVALTLILGTASGEFMGIEAKLDALGKFLQDHSGSSGDPNFVRAFVTASLTVCVGAMAIVGAIEDGLNGNYSILAVKSILDFVIIAIMSASMGKGSVFAAIPVFFFQGSVTLFAGAFAVFLTPLAIAYLSMVGSILIFCVGLNLVRQEKLRVANMLPACVFAVGAAYL